MKKSATVYTSRQLHKPHRRTNHNHRRQPKTPALKQNPTELARAIRGSDNGSKPKPLLAPTPPRHSDPMPKETAREDTQRLAVAFGRPYSTPFDAMISEEELAAEMAKHEDES